MLGWLRTAATGRTGLTSWSAISKGPRRDLVRGEEGLDAQLLQRDVERRAEGRDDAHERQAADAQRYEDLAGAGQRRLGVRARVAAQLGQQAGELRIVGRRDLAAQPGEQVRPPLAE